MSMLSSTKCDFYSNPNNELWPNLEAERDEVSKKRARGAEPPNAGFKKSKLKLSRTSHRFSATHLPMTIIESIAYFADYKSVEALSKVNREWMFIKTQTHPLTHIPVSLWVYMRIVHFLRHSKHHPLTWNAFEELYRIEKQINPLKRPIIFPSSHIHNLCLKNTDSFSGDLRWVKDSMPCLQTLDVSNCSDDQINDENLSQLSGLSVLSKLNLRRCGITNNGLEHLHSTAFPALTALDLNAREISDLGLQNLSGLMNLKKIKLPHNISDLGLDDLGRLPIEVIEVSRNTHLLTHFHHFTHLRKLVYRDSRITTLAFIQLQSCSDLQEFRFDGFDGFEHEITDVDLECFKFSKLQRLVLKYCRAITDAGWLSLVHSTALRELNLVGCNPSDEAMISLRRLKMLQRLGLASCQNLTDKGIKELLDPKLGLQNLQRLSLAHCVKISDKSLDVLGQITSLQELTLNYCVNVTNIGLNALKNLTLLQGLDLYNCWQITDEGVKSLEMLDALQNLDLGGCHQLTDESMQHLSLLSRLNHLYLDRTQITGRGLAFLSSIPQLRSLMLTKCRKIADEGFLSLTHLTALIKLGMYDTEISDKGLLHLRALTQLQELDVTCRKITDEGISNLDQFENLRILKISSRIHSSTLRELYRKFPIRCSQESKTSESDGLNADETQGFMKAQANSRLVIKTQYVDFED